MKKTLLYFLLFAALGFGTWYFVFKEKGNVFGNEEAGFQIKDTGRIGKIFLVRTNGESITLQRKNDGWTVNEKYKVLQSALQTLLITFVKQQPSYPVPEHTHNQVVKALSGNSVKTEVYDREGKKMAIFYVGSPAVNYNGTYMLMEGGERPYVVQIRGFDGFLNSRYSTSMDDWRDRIIFQTKAEDISLVKLEYPTEPLNSFSIVQNEKLSVLTEPGVPGSNPLNEKRTQSYLKFFEKIYCEGFLEGIPGLDSVIKSVPRRCAIELTDNKGKTDRVDIYWMPINKRSKNQLSSAEGVPDEFDSDRYYAVVNNKDTAIVQDMSFGKLFRKAYEFYQADKTEIPGVPK